MGCSNGRCSNVKLVSCNNCSNLKYEYKSSDNPHIWVYCSKGRWTGTESLEDLKKLIKCEDFHEQNE